MFLLAIENKLPVVPVSIRGSRTVMPKGRLAVSPATVDVYIHDAIDTRTLTRDDARGLAERARSIIDAAVHPGPEPT
jgi:1-acyl-sn-glycerol-3-phosphate acyltransferase